MLSSTAMDLNQKKNKEEMMAHGVLCKHCGWQETEHDDQSLLTEEERNQVIPGYKKTLKNCKYYARERKYTEQENERRQQIINAEHLASL